MIRECTHCSRPFTPKDLSREESRNMEAERKAHGLEGIRFLYYRCPACETREIFVDVLPRDDEFIEDFENRRAEMEAIVRQLHTDSVAVVVVPVEHR